MAILETLDLPIVQAPLAGGASTPALAAAVSEAGGLGFLAAGYKRAATVEADLGRLRELTTRPFGLNVFAPPAAAADVDAVRSYAGTLRDEGELGEPRHDDDDWEAKLALVEDQGPPVVSFTFGCPDPAVVERLRAAGSEIWVTVTSPGEARLAYAAGADALVVQGAEAGGHRAFFVDDDTASDLGVLAALQLVGDAVPLPLIATGGLVTGGAVAAVLAAGARAAQLGTAFMRCPEAGTAGVHRDALGTEASTALTRAFSGRTARGVVNRFMREHSSDAPAAYPEVHHLTAPLRAVARERGDADRLHLWAGQAHALVADEPAGEIVRRLAAEAAAALEDARRRL